MEEDKASNAMITDTLIMEHWQKAYDYSVKLFDQLAKDTKRKAFPEDYDVWALSALKIGDIEKGAHVYRTYIEFEPSKAPEIYGMLAKHYYDAKNYPQAIAYYTRRMETNPLTNAEEYYFGLAQYYNKQYVEADSSFAKVLRATPNYATGHLMRARIAQRIDSTNTLFLPKPHWEKYIEFASVDPVRNKNGLVEAYTYLAVYYVQNDDLKTGEEYFEKLLAIDPQDEFARQSLDSLEELKKSKGQKK